MATLSPTPKNTSPIDRYNELLKLDILPHEANYIVYLEYHSNIYVEHRLLELLYNSHTRKCAEVILNLESQRKKSLIELNLQLFLLNPKFSESVKVFLGNQYRKYRSDYMYWIYHLECVDSFETIISLWYPAHWCDSEKYICYLNNKDELRPDEEQLLQLLNDETAHDYILDIMVLSNLEIRLPYEEDYLKLLKDPFTRRHAQMILETKSAPYEDLSVENRNILVNYFLHSIAPDDSFGTRIQGFYAPLYFLGQRTNLSARALLENQSDFTNHDLSKREVIHQLIRVKSERILKIYLSRLHVHEILAFHHIDPNQAEEIIAYKERTLSWLEFNLIKYFYTTQQKFSDEKLDYLLSEIIEKMVSPIKNNLHVLVNKVIEEIINHDTLEEEESHQMRI